MGAEDSLRLPSYALTMRESSMKTTGLPSILAALLACSGFSVAAESAGKAGGGAVTTTWLKDPFANAAPKAVDRYAIVEIDTPARTPSVLLGAYDVENDPLTVSSFASPAHGSATSNNDGTFTYKPRAGYVGSDSFRFKLSDSRGGFSTATMHVSVIKPTGKWSTTNFVDLSAVHAAGELIRHGNSTTVPRAVDWDRNGTVDLLVGTNGGVWWYRNVGTPTEARFAAGVKVRAGGVDVRLGSGRVAISCVDMDGDGKRDLIVMDAAGRRIRFLRNVSPAAGEPVLAAPRSLKAESGEGFIIADIRAEVADWNADGLPDIITGSRSGSVKIAYNVGTPSAPRFEAPTTAIDAEHRTISGSYNLNVRVFDLNQDGIPDFVDSYNWGDINFRINAGSGARPRLPVTGEFSVAGPRYAPLDLHALCDGPIVDFADFDGDGTLDLVAGGELGGKVWIGRGQSGRTYLREIRGIIAARPDDLGAELEKRANSAIKKRMQALQGALYDYIVSFATPGQKREIERELLDLISAYPQYFALRTLDLERQPGIPSLAVQTWLTLLVANYHDPAARKRLADAAQFTGGYRKLVEEIGLIYADNGRNPRGAEAIYQWVRTIPREVYPGTCITANDWLGGRTFLVRGHMKNTFNGSPVDRGEYGFGKDARAVIGGRGSENWFMTVVHHEACHDVDAYVRRLPDLNRRWGQTLVLAGGPDMRTDPDSGWLSWDLTRRHFREAGLWNGRPAQWDAAWKKYWGAPPGSDWNTFGFMRGNISWFYGAPQESLATQGNQYWNSTEGRIEVALDRWKRGYRSNLTEVLFFMDIWSLGLDKIKFYENDNACRQVISFARLRRNAQGYIDRIDLGDRAYEFTVDPKGIVTGIVRVP